LSGDARALEWVEKARAVFDTHGSVTPQSSHERPLRLLIVDDHPAFRKAARRLLEARSYDVVAEADCGTRALDAVERLEPQAVLLDVRLGDEDGFAVCNLLTRARPGLAVLLTSDSNFEHCEEAIARSGARGFVRKSRLVQTDLAQFWRAADASGNSGAALTR
jgi:DNA-binding NarL/FixJ family response regulator